MTWKNSSPVDVITSLGSSVYLSLYTMGSSNEKNASISGVSNHLSRSSFQ